MPRYSVAQAKDKLSGLLDKAIAGEEVVITRRGEPIVEFRPVRPAGSRSREELDAWLDARRNRGPFVPIGSVELLNQMYDEDPAP